MKPGLLSEDIDIKLINKPVGIVSQSQKAVAKFGLPLKSPVSATTTVNFFSWFNAVSIFLRLSGDTLDMLQQGQ